ncbi:MAG TPA: hypothetical protein VFJ16_22155 [Longimicrobium sp.]|nr:hypothetical protein [Longimicrobium sp.]
MAQPADTQIVIDNLHVAGPAPEPPPSTLGQTPHEPAVRPWELELLISGALVFSMIQLPGQLDAWFNGVRPRLDGGWFMAAFMGWLYVKMALYALVGGFVAHLSVRGYWVGVIGLEAVFPNGIVWDRMRAGPIMRELQRERTPSLQTLIDRADRLASMIFGAAFAIALMFAYSMVIGGLLVVGSVAMSRWLIGDPGKALMATELVLAVLIAPMMIAGLVDRRMGDRLDPDGRAARVIRRIGRVAGRAGTTVLFMPLMYTLLTNLRQKRHGTVLMMIVMGFMGLVVVKDVLIPRGAIRTDGYAFLPDDGGAATLAHDFYADQRDNSAEAARLPQIQSDIIRDPYVRLFVPYVPRRHNELVARRCPAVPAAAVRNAGWDQAVLRCLAALQPVALNGKPVGPAWHFYTQPETGLRGMIAYLPTAALPKGENVITVAQLPDPEAGPAARRNPDPPYRIPFWL